MSFAGKLRLADGTTARLQHSSSAEASWSYLDRSTGTAVDLRPGQLADVTFARCSPRKAPAHGTPAASGAVLRKVLAQFSLPVADGVQGTLDDGVIVPDDEPTYEAAKAAAAAAARPTVVAYVAVPSTHCQLFLPRLRELYEEYYGTQRRLSAVFTRQPSSPSAAAAAAGEAGAWRSASLGSRHSNGGEASSGSGGNLHHQGSGNLGSSGGANANGGGGIYHTHSGGVGGRVGGGGAAAGTGARPVFIAVDLSRVALRGDGRRVRELPALRVFLPGGPRRGRACANAGRVEKELSRFYEPRDGPRLVFWCICC